MQANDFFEKLTVLGTGNAQALACYNTCFTLSGTDCDGEHLLVDAGGGNGILLQLKKAGIPLSAIHHIFVTHEHCDHVLGVIWLIRAIATAMLKNTYTGILHIYCHKQLALNLEQMCRFTLQKKITDLFTTKIMFHFVDEEPDAILLGKSVHFFSIHSTKALQYGFSLQLSCGKKLTCLGDEPLNDLCAPFVANAGWVLSEAFCLYSEREKFKPYEKHHSTVKEACLMASSYQVKNLVLWHTEDSDIAHRRERYTAEGHKFYSGNLFVPDDLDVIELS
jgi:ribonuclease Z